MPAELRQPADTVCTIREQVVPAELSAQPVEALPEQSASEGSVCRAAPAPQIRPATYSASRTSACRGLSQPADTARTIREQVAFAELPASSAIRPAPSSANRSLPAVLRQPS